MERHSFRIVSDESLETMWNCAFPQNSHTWKLCEIKVFYAVSIIDYGQTAARSIYSNKLRILNGKIRERLQGHIIYIGHKGSVVQWI